MFSSDPELDFTARLSRKKIFYARLNITLTAFPFTKNIKVEMYWQFMESYNLLIRLKKAERLFNGLKPYQEVKPYISRKT